MLMPCSTAIPPGLPEHAARFRTEVADRRMLIVLDNAASADQVRPLLPGYPHVRRSGHHS